MSSFVTDHWSLVRWVPSSASLGFELLSHIGHDLQVVGFD